MRYLVNPKTNLAKIPKDAEAVHLVRPVKAVKIGTLLRNRNITEISISKSCRQRLAPKALKLIEGSGAKLVEETLRGRALGTGMEKISEIVEMHRMDKSYREIEKKLGIPKSTAHYLIRYAERLKVKRGSQIVGLK